MTSRRTTWRRVWQVLTVWLLPAHVLALVLLWESITMRGTLAGVAAVVALSATVAAALSTRRRDDVVCAALVASSLAVCVGLAVSAPSGASNDRVQSVWRDGPPRLSPAWWIPEIDQVMVGAALAGLVDPIIRRKDTPRLQRMVRAIYEPAAHDPALRELGSALHEMWTFGVGRHHFTILPPPSSSPSSSKPLAVVFLHGSAGNFLGYTALWKRVSDAADVFVVEPSYAFGGWDNASGVGIAERARADAIAAGADPARIVLAGLSNGGKGVTRAFRAHPELWAGIILLSAVSEREVLEPPIACGGKPALVLHGEADNRVEVQMARDAAASLERGGCVVTLEVEPARDHFWMFDAPDDVVARLVAWLTSPALAAAAPAAPADPL